MSNIKNTKGVSSTIAIVLIITLAVALISVIYPVIKGIINSPALSPELCKDVVIDQGISMTVACFDPSTSNLEVTLTKNGKASINSLLFEIGFENETKKWECNSDCGNCKVLGKETKTYYFFPGENPKTITLIGKECTLAVSEIMPCK